jgi:hypothetical protein
MESAYASQYWTHRYEVRNCKMDIFLSKELSIYYD